MKFDDVLEALSGQTVHRSSRWDAQVIRAVVAGDLMSDVLVTDQDEVLLVTSLPSDQVARTADMVGACGIVLVNGKVPQPPLVDLCSELDLTLIRTTLGSFEASFRIGERLLKA
ncbi:MAG TPA: DRTGG domain-containing protein [Spirochaetia bacterium]|jgi:hypothetical protein|nr:DRTGG domain-containing protein [Spirochaetia bacterium]